MVINDQTSLTEVVTGVQEAISRGAFGIVADTPVFYAADRYPQQAGIPVTGASVDGPEWGEKPYTNMFASDVGSVNPSYPAGTQLGDFLRAHGGTVMASYGYGVAALSAHSAQTSAESFQKAGGKVGVVDTSVPYGSVAFTTQALVAKQKGVNAVYAGLQNNSNLALLTAMQQAGVKLKAAVFPTGYQANLVGTPAWKALQGDYFLAEFRPFQLPDAGTTRWRRPCSATSTARRRTSPPSASTNPGSEPTS